MKKYLALILLSSTAIAYAQNLGVYGAVFPIAEPDLVDFIHTRLNQMEQDGEMAKMQQKFIETVKAHALRPTPVAGIETASKESIHYYDPTFRVNQDIFDSK